MNTEPLLRVTDLSVTLDKQPIFSNLSFDLFENERLVILGPNGAGKSVLIKTLLGMFAYSGSIAWKAALKFGYVPQRVQIGKESPITVADFFALKSVSKSAARTLLSHVGIEGTEYLSKHIADLSSGQLQRVLIAWATDKDPDVLLLDEPLSSVDIGGEDTLHKYLHESRTNGRSRTVILVTHDLSMVYGEATTVLCMNRNRHYIGKPKDVLDQSVLEQVYGREVQFVSHQHE